MAGASYKSASFNVLDSGFGDFPNIHWGPDPDSIWGLVQLQRVYICMTFGDHVEIGRFENLENGRILFPLHSVTILTKTRHFDTKIMIL